MLMWEIFAGHPPFDKRVHNCRLMLDICEGLRPSILARMPDDYAQVMQKCWDVDPTKRPMAVELLKFADKFYKSESFENSNDIIGGDDSGSSGSNNNNNNPLAY